MPKLTALLILFSASTLSFIWQFARAAPCPAETPLQGAPLKGTSDEYMTYFAVSDDDQTKIVGVRACFQNSVLNTPREHFRGFRP